MDGFNFSIPISPRFFDLDVYRHVNNAVYSTYCEEARVAYCRHLDIFQPGPERVGFVISKAAFEYLSPVKLGEELELFIRAHDLGRARFKFSYVLLCPARSKVVFQGETACVCWNLDKARPVRLGERERRIMTGFEGLDRG